jgi:hypothetical protein
MWVVCIITWLIVILCVLGVTAFILGSSIELKLIYIRERENDKFVLNLRGLFGLVRLRYHIPILRLKTSAAGVGLEMTEQHRLPTQRSRSAPAEHFITRDKMERAIRTARHLIEHRQHLAIWWRQTCQHIHVMHWNWQTRLGWHDAPTTAVTSGILWSLKSLVIGWVSQTFRIQRMPSIQITPVYDQQIFRTEFKIIMKMRFIHALFSFSRLAMRVARSYQGWKTWILAMRHT